MGEIPIPPVLYLTVNEELQDLFSRYLEGEADGGPSCGKGELIGAGAGDTNISFPGSPGGMVSRP